MLLTPILGGGRQLRFPDLAEGGNRSHGKATAEGWSNLCYSICAVTCHFSVLCAILAHILLHGVYVHP